MKFTIHFAALLLGALALKAQTLPCLIQIGPNTNQLGGAWYLPNGFRSGNWATNYADKQVTISWNAPSNSVCQVQHRPSLTWGAWEGISPLLTNANSFTFGEEPNWDGAANMFYRVIALQ